MSSAPVFAHDPPVPDHDRPPVTTSSAQAVGLLESAATAARTLTWSGTQQVVSTRFGEPRLTVLEIQHAPGAGSTVRVLLSQDQAVASDVLDQSLLSLLTRHYDLRVAGDSVCAGHHARVVEARMHEDVLQLSYSDGLSTLSLFVQAGELPGDPGGSARPMGGGTVWVSPGATERVVWSGDGRTWTLLSDAPGSTVEDTVLVLPHTAAAVTDDGVLDRAWRGMSRVGSWLNPFD